MGYEETLKDTMETEAEEEAKEQQQDDDYEQYDIVPKMKLVYEGISRKQFRMGGNFNGVNTRMAGNFNGVNTRMTGNFNGVNTRMAGNFNGVNTRMVIANLTRQIEMREKVSYSFNQRSIKVLMRF